MSHPRSWTAAALAPVSVALLVLFSSCAGGSSEPLSSASPPLGTTTVATPPATATPAPTAVIVAPPTPQQPRLVVHFIDVGQGDAVLVESGEDDILVDGGPPGAGLPAYLARQHLPDVDLLVLTHPHSDHYGGLADVLARYDVRQVWTNGEPGPSAWATAVAGEGAPVLPARRGQSVTFGDVTLTVLHPADPLVGDDNADSVVLRLSCGSVSVLLTGDANRDSEESMLGDPSVVLDSDVLKVGHHGSATSTTNAFLDAVTAADAVISVGAGNSYHHPTQPLLDRLAAHGVPVYRTDLAGSIVLTSDCTTFTIGPEAAQ